MALTDFVITDAGREMMTRAALEGDVIFTRGAVGRGALKPGSSLAARTTMNDRMADMRVAAPEISGDTVRIRCQFSNADGRGGYLPAFRWNECGLFARLNADGAETLIAYANTCDAAAGDMIPASECEFEVEFAIAIASAEGLSFGSEGMIFATRHEMSVALTQKANNTHSQSASTITEGVLSGRVLANTDAIAALTGRQV
ncbi:MAG: hypothetical protein MR418_09725, partial [Clostridiales bacterium]|nr:hypothetical protein [Clostridiales bacterium]